MSEDIILSSLVLGPTDQLVMDGEKSSPVVSALASSPPLPTRPACTLDSNLSLESQVTSENTVPLSRKRRVTGGITLNACTNCKKARAKVRMSDLLLLDCFGQIVLTSIPCSVQCDGVKPACKRCATRHIPNTCHYEMHAKTAKEQMIQEIRRLRQENEDLEEQNDGLVVEKGWIEKIISSLRDDGQNVEILYRLKRGQSPQGIAEWLGRPLLHGAQLSPASEIDLKDAIERYHKDFVEQKDPRYWTSVTTDVALIEHLLSLYLCWVHPVHMLFDETQFMSSLRDCADVYCSASLVNGVCAMSCHLLHNICNDEDKTRQIIASLRSRFMDEARVLLKGVDSTKITSIQTYAIMFLVEVSVGNGLMASSHLRMATETIVAKRTTEQSPESFEVTYWGIMTLHTYVRVYIRDVPQC